MRVARRPLKRTVRFMPVVRGLNMERTGRVVAVVRGLI